MKRLLTLVAFFATLQASAQQVNPVPDYVFRNQMSVGRGTVTDTAAYFSIGPRYGATKGFMPPIVGDTATFSSGKRNGLLIFSVQKNKFLYWDSVRVQWSDMAGSSGTYITGSGITGYVPQFNGTTTIDTSALFTLGNRLGVGTSSFAYNTTSTANVELNGTAGGILGFKRNDSARGYLWHTGSDMELANTTAGTLSFNTNSATRGSISSAGVWRLHNLAGTGDRVVVASSNGTLSASTSVTGLVDTLTISTRAWRQKGLDSLAALEVSGSGTTNYVPKFTAASTIGNSQIFDNGTNVGVATASPGYRLTISGPNTAGSVSALAIENPSTNSASEVRQEFRAGGTTWGYITNGYNSNSPFMAFGVSAASAAPTERIRITSGGNVGIGTTNPLAKLDVASGHIKIDDAFSFYWGAASTSINGSSTTNIIDLYTNSAVRQRIFANGRIGINTTTDAGYQLDVNGTLRSVNGANFATTSGNVGIGTASPQRRLSLNVPFASTGDIGYLVSGQTGTTPLVEITSIVENVATAATAMGFVTYTANAGSATEKMRLTNNAELLINTTSDAGDYKLQVAGNIYNTGSAVLAATSGGAAVGSSTVRYKFNAVKSGISAADIVAQVSLDNGVGGYGAALAFSSEGNNIGTHKVGIGNVRTGGWDVSDLVFYANSTVAQGDFTASDERMRLKSDGEFLINTTTDAGDYKLQVVGNARIGTGKLDIASNTTFGIGVARSGTSEVAGQIYNSNGILYLGAESSAGGQIFTGSSAYAAVIGSGANYPLQFASNNITRATINTAGELLIGSTTDAGAYALQVTGAMYTTSTITTASPTADPVKPWKLGSVQAGTVALDTANYVEVEINGVYYRLAIVTPL